MVGALDQQLSQIPYAPPQRFLLATFMSDKETLWRAMVRKYNLLGYSFQRAAAWPFGEAIFNLDHDVMLPFALRQPSVGGVGGCPPIAWQ